jgi:hypothetical protein
VISTAIFGCFLEEIRYAPNNRRVTTDVYLDTIIKLSEISTKLEIPLDNLFDSVEEKRQDRPLMERYEIMEKGIIIGLLIANI